MSGISRDFTRKSVHELRDIIKKNVDDEGQFGFFDWFQDTFLMQELNIQNYVNNVNEYHAKMVDKHNIGSSEFDKILERVHSVDTNYASRLNRLTDQVNALSNRVTRMANMLNPSVITANSSDFAKLSEGIRVKYQNVRVQSNAEIEKCKQSMPLLYDKQWYENVAESVQSCLNDAGQVLIGMGWGGINFVKDILLTPKYIADDLCDFINNDPIGKINGFPAYVLNGGIDQCISNKIQKFGSDFANAELEKKSEMVMGILSNVALLYMPGTAIAKFGKAGEAVEVAEDVIKGGKVAESLKDIPKVEKGVNTLEDAQKAAKAAEEAKLIKNAAETVELGSKLKSISNLNDALASIRAAALNASDSKSLTNLLKSVDETVFNTAGKATLKREILQRSGFTNFDSRGTLADVLGFKDMSIEVEELKDPIKLYRRGYPGESTSPNGLGRWWGDAHRTINQVRNDLAVCDNWGNPLTAEYTITVPKGTKVLKGVAARQTVTDATGKVIESRAGGGIEYWLNDIPSGWLN